MKNIKRINEFLNIDEGVDNEALEKLASEISDAETEEGVAKFDIEEFNIDGILFLVSGTVEYLEKKNRGNWVRYTEPSSERSFHNAELDILWNDGSMEEDLPLNEEQISFVINMIEIYN